MMPVYYLCRGQPRGYRLSLMAMKAERMGLRHKIVKDSNGHIALYIEPRFQLDIRNYFLKGTPFEQWMIEQQKRIFDML